MNQPNPAIKVATIYEIVCEIVNNHSAMLVRASRKEQGKYEYKPMFSGNTANRWMIIDAQSANAIKTVADNLTEENRNRFLSMNVLQMGQMAWKLIAKCRK